MDPVKALKAEEYAKTLLLDSGIVEELKESRISIWTIKASPDRLYIAIDLTQNPAADFQAIRKIIQTFLAPLANDLGIAIEVQALSIEDNCCYGVCHGCLNGDPGLQKKWIAI